MPVGIGYLFEDSVRFHLQHYQLQWPNNAILMTGLYSFVKPRYSFFTHFQSFTGIWLHSNTLKIQLSLENASSCVSTALSYTFSGVTHPVSWQRPLVSHNVLLEVPMTGEQIKRVRVSQIYDNPYYTAWFEFPSLSRGEPKLQSAHLFHSLLHHVSEVSCHFQTKHLQASAPPDLLRQRGCSQCRGHANLLPIWGHPGLSMDEILTCRGIMIQ